MASAPSNLYNFIRLRLGDAMSDREIARRWGFPWRSFTLLKAGERPAPRVAQLVDLAAVLNVSPAAIFEVARGVPAGQVNGWIERGGADGETLSSLSSGESGERQRIWRGSHAGLAGVQFSLDLKFTVTSANGGFLDLLERRSAEVINQPLWQFVVEQQRDALDSTFAPVLRDGRATGLIMTLVSQNGGCHVTEIGAIRIETPAGMVQGIGCRANVVTHYHDAISALREDRDRWRRLVLAAPAFLCDLDEVGRVLTLNRTMLGESGEERVGKLFTERLDEESQAAAKTELKKCRETRQPRTFDVRAHSNGVTKSLRIVMGPRIHQGKVSGFVLVACEIDSTNPERDTIPKR